MKQSLLFIITLFIISSCINNRETFMISGRVTDFSGNPIDSATIRIKNKAFENVYETLSDSNGNYSIEVNKGNYYCLYAIKLSEYRISKLEYWAWNIPVFDNIVINPQYDKIEIYGINIFEPQVTPQETYIMYFRPMSLLKTLELSTKQKINKKKFQKAKQAENLFKKTKTIINIAPETISIDELEIKINGTKAKILGINKTTEYARGIFMYGYNVQILKPTNHNEKQDLKYDRISIILHSTETDEMGMAETFVKK